MKKERTDIKQDIMHERKQQRMEDINTIKEEKHEEKKENSKHGRKK